MAMDGYIFERMLNLPVSDPDMHGRLQQTALDLLK